MRLASEIMYLRKSKYNIGIVLLQQVGVSCVCLGLGY